MKIRKNEDGYSHLLNDEKKEVFCIKRHPVQTIIADKLGQPVAVEMPTRASLCGDHCPFFNFTPDPENLNIGEVELCHQHIRGIDEIVNDIKPSKKLELL